MLIRGIPCSSIFDDLALNDDWLIWQAVINYQKLFITYSDNQLYSTCLRVIRRSLFNLSILLTFIIISIIFSSVLCNAISIPLSRGYVKQKRSRADCSRTWSLVINIAPGF